MFESQPTTGRDGFEVLVFSQVWLNCPSRRTFGNSRKSFGALFRMKSRMCVCVVENTFVISIVAQF